MLTVYCMGCRTALFNPLSATYCLPPTSGSKSLLHPEAVLIPVITNNSEPYKLWYSVQSLTDPESRAEPIPLMGSQLVRGDRRLLQKRLAEGADEEDADDYYLDGRNAHAAGHQQSQQQGTVPPALRAIGGTAGQSGGEGSAPTAYHVRSVKPGDKVSSLPRTIEPSQTIYYLPIKEPGWVQLERVQDADESDFRIRKTSRHALVIECPSEGKMLGVVEDERAEEKDGDEKTKARSVLKKALFKGDHALAKRTASGPTAGGIHHRCVGDDSVVKMRVRGVGELHVGWLIREGKGKDSKVIEEGVIQGIQHSDPVSVGANARGEPLLLKDKDERAAATGGQVVLANKEKQLAVDRKVSFNAAAETHDAFLPIPHRQLGRYEVEFLNVTDQFGNFLRPAQTQSTVFEVHPLPVVSFTNFCAQPRRLKLQQNGTVSLPIIMPGARHSPDGTTRVRISFKPSTDGDEASAWEREFEMEGKSLAVPVGQPGTYSIEEANSPYCRGVVNEPATCVVEAVPVPKAEVKMESLSNEWCVISLRCPLVRTWPQG